MRRLVLGFVLCSSLALGACATSRQAQLTSGELAASKACAAWRWIGIKGPSADDDECPGAGREWRVSQLFDPQAGAEQREPYGKQQEPDAQQRIPTADVVRELNRFCVYETADPDKKPRRPPFPQAAGAGLVRLDRDCATISRAGDLSGATLADLSGHFLSQAGMPPTPMDINNQLGVRLAFLDTEPTGVAFRERRGTSLHGYTLAHIARHLVCSPETENRCAAQITTRLALPVVRFDSRSRRLTEIDLERGGRIGRQSDLADAIVDEVDDWLTARRDPHGPQHLVLNLSLGWDPQLLGGLDAAALAEVQSGTQAVYQALEYAASLDVLVLAAAGNKKDCCPSTKGPLLPAGWEQEAAGDGRSAEALGGPLIYAVGGVGSDGNPLSNARYLGMPRRVAHGENAVVTSWPAGRTTWLYTGSSVATAVVSSTAALVWDSFPHLRPKGVMDILDNSGRPLFEADFWFGGGEAPMTHRVSLCTALQRACDQRPPGTLCPLRGECAPWKPERTAFPCWTSQPLARACHPWLVPQPEDPPCPPCDPPPPP
jgi:hypothetical protein